MWRRKSRRERVKTQRVLNKELKKILRRIVQKEIPKEVQKTLQKRIQRVLQRVNPKVSLKVSPKAIQRALESSQLRKVTKNKYSLERTKRTHQKTPRRAGPHQTARHQPLPA